MQPSDFIRPIDDILKYFNLDYLVKYNTYIAIIFYLFSLLTIKVIYSRTKSAIQYKKQLKDDTDLYPSFDQDDVKEYTHNYIPTRFQFTTPTKEEDVFISENDNSDNNFGVSLLKPDFYSLLNFFIYNSFDKEYYSPKYQEKRGINWIIRNLEELFYPEITLEKKDLARKRFIIILADTGMGKTAFMVNLCLKYLKKKNRRFKLVLFPFTTKDLDDKIKSVEDKKNVILLLDGLDEDPLAMKDSEFRRLDLLEKVQEFRKVIITCRSQFFFHEDFEWYKTETIQQSTKLNHTFGKVFISPFNNQDVYDYLAKTYSRDKKKHERSRKIVAKIPYLMARPIILKYIDSFIDQTIDYKYVFEVYEVIVDNWIKREQFNIPNCSKDKFYLNMIKFSVSIAKYLYERPQNNLIILSDEIDFFAKNNNISLNSLELKNKSLLNRGEKDKYKFAHKSVMEYFLSISLYNNDFLTKFNNKGYDAAVIFYRERCFKFHTEPFLNNLVQNGKEIITPYDRDEISDILYQKLGIDKQRAYNIGWSGSKQNSMNWKPFIENIIELHINDITFLSDGKIFIPMINLKKIFIKNCIIPHNIEFTNFLNIHEIILDNSTLTEEAISNIKSNSKTRILKFI